MARTTPRIAARYACTSPVLTRNTYNLCFDTPIGHGSRPRVLSRASRTAGTRTFSATSRPENSSKVFNCPEEKDVQSSRPQAPGEAAEDAADAGAECICAGHLANESGAVVASGEDCECVQQWYVQFSYAREDEKSAIY
jgi:hypothetical protein